MTDEEHVLKNQETGHVERSGSKQYMEQLRRNFNTMYQTNAWIVEPFKTNN